MNYTHEALVFRDLVLSQIESGLNVISVGEATQTKKTVVDLPEMRKAWDYLLKTLSI